MRPSASGGGVDVGKRSGGVLAHVAGVVRWGRLGGGSTAVGVLVLPTWPRHLPHSYSDSNSDLCGSLQLHDHDWPVL